MVGILLLKSAIMLLVAKDPVLETLLSGKHTLLRNCLQKQVTATYKLIFVRKVVEALFPDT